MCRATPKLRTLPATFSTEVLHHTIGQKITLYNEIMNRNEGFDMNGHGEDLFFLSNGHISPVYYSVLARSGYFPVNELNTFRLLDSRLQGHPTTHEGLPGVRIASGSLGQ